MFFSFDARSTSVIVSVVLKIEKWFVLLSFSDHVMIESVNLVMTAIMTLTIHLGSNTLAHSFCSA